MSNEYNVFPEGSRQTVFLQQHWLTGLVLYEEETRESGCKEQSNCWTIYQEFE